MTSRKLSDCHNIGYNTICDIRNGKIDKAKAVIKKYGLEHSKSWLKGYTLLCEALKNRHKEFTEYVLTFQNVKVNNINKFPIDTPLHLAAGNGYKGIVKKLLARGADINAVNGQGRTPFDVAVEFKRCSIIEYFLTKKNLELSTSAKWFYYPLLHSAAKSSVIIVQSLLVMGLEVDFVKNGLTPLHRAAFNSCLAVVKCLVEHKANVNAVSTSKEYLGFTALHFAAKKSDAEIVNFLLENGASIDSSNKHGSTPFYYALETGNMEVIEVFIKHHVDINAVLKNGAWGEKLTPLQFAVKSKNESMVKFLLKNGADINIPDQSGRNILNFTLSHCVTSLDIWKTLAMYGADIELDESRQKSKESLLHLITESHHYDDKYMSIVKFLILLGADVNAVDAAGGTPLFSSIRQNKKSDKPSKFVMLLLIAGANVNVKDLKGKTPLHIACELGNIRDADNLIKFGADINIRCLDDMLPVDYCMSAIVNAEENDSNVNTDQLSDIIKIIIGQAILSEAAGLYVDERYHLMLATCPSCKCSSYDYPDFVIKILHYELSILKKKYIACNVTFYNLLFKSSHELAILKKNPAFIKSIEDTDIIKEFPNYCGVVLRNLEAASVRMKMIEESQKRDIYRIFPGTPVEVAEYIFKFLDNQDFYNLLQAL